jgi:hypothetical protein
MSAFIPQLWADRIFKHFREKSVVEDLTAPTIHLDPKDVWAPSGEDFSEAVAWARLLGIQVTKPHGRALAENFIISKPPGHIPRMVPICSPPELIDVLRRFASSSSNTFIHAAPSPAQPKVRHGRVAVRR